MNEITRQKIAEKLVAAITDGKLLNKDVAVKFETDSATMSHLKRPENFNRISPRVWTNFRQWYYSETPLAEFKLMEEILQPSEQTPKPAAAEAPVIKTEGSKYQDVSSTPYPPQRIKKTDKKPKDEEAKSFKAEARAATRQMREEYENAHHPESVMLKDGSKVDLSQIDFRTGSIITIEAYADHTTITIKHPDK